MNRPIVQAWTGAVAFIVLGAISILLTNALFDVTASSKPSITFSIVSATPAAAAKTP